MRIDDVKQQGPTVSNPFSAAALAHEEAVLQLIARAYAADPKATASDLIRLGLGHYVARFEVDRLAGRLGQ
jgi:hypothetical protein